MKNDLNSSIDFRCLGEIKSKLMRRKEFLIEISHNRSIPMYQLDRDCIQSYFERGESPARPNNIPKLMKLFFTSCFTYAPLRKYLISVSCNDSIPTASMLPSCLSKVYCESRFLSDESWYPDKIYDIAQFIQNRDVYNLNSIKFKPRMVAVLLSGSKEMSIRIKGGLNNFYSELENINNSTSNEMWKYVEDFSKPIKYVGPALICVFIKDMGFTKFVKVDHHFKKEFPRLLGVEGCKERSPKEHFVLSQTIADLLNISPFHLDHILYQWGRYKKYASTGMEIETYPDVTAL